MAAKLGLTVRQLLAATDARELAEWQIFLNIEAWQARIIEQNKTADERAAEITSALFGKGING